MKLRSFSTRRRKNPRRTSINSSFIRPSIWWRGRPGPRPLCACVLRAVVTNPNRPRASEHLRRAASSHPQRRLSCRNLHAVDRVYDQTVSAFLSAGNIKFMLLHEGRNEDNIRTFFNEVHAMYVQFLMNPFYEYQTPIVSQQFDKRVRAFARRL